MSTLLRDAVARVMGLALCCSVGAAGAVPVFSVNVTTSDGTKYNSPSVDSPATGANLVGAKVKVCFTDSTCDTVAMIAGGTGQAVATGAGWTLSVAGDTDDFAEAWTFSWGGRAVGNPPADALGIASLQVNGYGALSVFDQTSSPEGSPGSANGWPLSISDPSDLEALGLSAVDVLYTNALGIAGNFYSDLYTMMRVTFGNADGLTGIGSFKFRADTDTVPSFDEVGGGNNGVPEPASLALVGAALLGLAGVRRRRFGARA